MRRRPLWTGLGLLFALFPALAPLLGLALLRQRRRLRFRYAPAYLMAAALLGAPAVARGQNPTFLWGALFGLAAAAGAATLAARRLTEEQLRAAGRGIVAGLVLTAVAAGAQLLIGVPRPTAWPWVPHANYLGHQTIVVSVVAMLLLGVGAGRACSWAMGALVVLASGSRAALAGMALLGASLLGRVRGILRWTVGLTLGTLLIVVGLLALPTGRRVLPAATLAWKVLAGRVPSPFPANLIVEGDDLRAAPWLPSGARAEPGRVDDGSSDSGAEQTWVVRKTASGAQAGLRQRVTLRPDTAYVFSVELRASRKDQEPGVVAVHGADAKRLLLVTVGPDGVKGVGSDAVRLLGTSLEAVGDGWQRLVFRFHVTADEPGSAYIGPAVDARTDAGTGSTLAVRDPQLTVGTEPRPYIAVSQEDVYVAASADALLARWGYWVAAWQGFIEHPLTGSSLDGFSQRYQAWLAPTERGNTAPTHPHNLVLGVAYAGGIVALAGLSVLLITLYLGLSAGPGARLWTAVLWTVLAMNLVDFTFFYGGVLYPLAALAGWRSGLGDDGRGRRRRSRHERLP